MKFDYIEDYIEFIAGYREKSGTKLSIWNGNSSPISLARYDVGIVESFAHQLDDGKAFTDKQAELAKKIVLKYRKQLLALEVEIPDPMPDYRLGIRQVDRTRKISIVDDNIVIKFPYETDLISEVREHSKQSCGSFKFVQESKSWHLGLTEYNLNIAVAFGQKHQFEIDLEVLELFDRLVAVEKQSYAIELVSTGDKLSITNCPDSLTAYITEQLGGFELTNLIQLVDQSAVLGYTVSEELLSPLVHEYGEEFVSWLVSRTVKGSRDQLQSMISYAQVTNRTPVYVYDSGYATSMKENDVYYLNRSTPDFVEPKLLISASELLIGTRKQMWTTTAEKVFYIK